MDRRTFLQASFALAAGLAGCASDTNTVTATSGSTTTITPDPVSASMFLGHPDLADLTQPGEVPPTEHPRPERIFTNSLPELPAREIRARSLSDVFEYVVVVMFENRAFDQMVGYLYPNNVSSTGQPFNGVSGRTFTNSSPTGQTFTYQPATSLQTPLIDPSEEWQSVNLALWNTFNPLANATATSEGAYQAPYNIPAAGPTLPPPLNGFVTMFDWTLRNAGKPSTQENLQTIMAGFTPNMIPVFSQLAQSFAICDNWYCGVPSQTYTNRSFFQAASSSGLVNNTPYPKWVFENTCPTIFDSLSKANVPWKVYWDELDVICLTKLINYPTLKQYSDSNFEGMDSFYEAVEKGQLPRYSFVQPRFVLDNNSYHPYNGAPAVKRGEVLLNDIYSAIRASSSPTGSNYRNTLLVITFDEGGTCYDHAPPPPATSPGDGYTGDYGFQFDRLGQRIPTILVSPWFAPGTVISQQFDADSVIKMLEQKFNLAPLNQRDAASPSLGTVPVLDSPRSRASTPLLRVRKLSAEEARTNRDQELPDTGEGIISLAHALATGQNARAPGVRTVGDGLNYLQQVKGSL